MKDGDNRFRRSRTDGAPDEWQPVEGRSWGGGVRYRPIRRGGHGSRGRQSRSESGRGHLHTTWPEKALKDDPTPAFKLDLAHKDMGLALAMAAQLKVPAVTGAAGREVYAMARAQGRGEDDWTTGILRTVKALSASDR